jgi:hypothetical protein
VPNFDYAGWPGQAACLDATRRLRAHEHVWLAQESRSLPGAERVLHRELSSVEQARWRLESAETPGAPLADVLARWPSGEWLVTARYHAALAGAWAGSKLVVLSTNEKLRGIARELGVPLLAPDADEPAAAQALAAAVAVAPPFAFARHAINACAEFVRLGFGSIQR